MRWSLVFLLLISMFAGCQQAPAIGQDRNAIVSQRSIADIACGSCAMFNWMSHGGTDLQRILKSLSKNKTPEETVLHIIDTYGLRQSATKPSVKRYGTHNGGVGSINLMLMAKELLGDHLDSPPTLRGEYLHRLTDESTSEHLARVKDWFSESIDSGVPVLFYLRCYHRSDGKRPAMVFGHHVVISAIDADVSETEAGVQRIGFTFVDSSSGLADQGYLSVADQEFTAPTYKYRFKKNRALTTETVRTGRPLLEIRIQSYESANPPRTRIITAHFATFAENQANN